MAHQLRQTQKESVGLNRGAAVPTRVDEKPTLASQGIDKNLAHQARALGALSDDKRAGGFGCPRRPSAAPPRHADDRLPEAALPGRLIVGPVLTYARFLTAAPRSVSFLRQCVCQRRFGDLCQNVVRCSFVFHGSP
jgi:hypothetical protein